MVLINIFTKYYRKSFFVPLWKLAETMLLLEQGEDATHFCNLMRLSLWILPSWTDACLHTWRVGILLNSLLIVMCSELAPYLFLRWYCICLRIISLKHRLFPDPRIWTICSNICHSRKNEGPNVEDYFLLLVNTLNSVASEGGGERGAS